MSSEDTTKEVLNENRLYKCRVHEKCLLPVLCGDCESPICVDCLVTIHVGHKMCKISEHIEDKLNKLNDALVNKESACFDLKKIQENLQKRRENVRSQREQMVKRVVDREEEIVTVLKNVCQQTIEQITNLALEIEGPMMNDEKFLDSLMRCDLFKMDTDEEMIKTLYFYNALELLNCEYIRKTEGNTYCTFVTRSLSQEKIIDLVGTIVADEHLSSDEIVETSKTVENTENTEDNRQFHLYQQRCLNSEIDAIMLTASKEGLLYSKGVLYQQSYSNVDKVLENVEHFTYAPKSDEIIFILKSQRNKVWRQYALGDGRPTPFMTIQCKYVITMSHSDLDYLTIVYVNSETLLRGPERRTYHICRANDIGCLREPIIHLRNDFYFPLKCRFCMSSFVVFETRRIRILVKKASIYEESFSYAGCVGNHPQSTFTPKDLCIDQAGNFLVIDCYDSTVHLLNPDGKFMKLIMSAEDGLNEITCVALDSSGWLWLGCKDGVVNFANYDYFKDTNREERRLEKHGQNKKTY